MGSHPNKSPLNRERVKKAVAWIAEATIEHPETQRPDLLRQAAIRFDLSPAECEFLSRNFACPPQQADSR